MSTVFLGMERSRLTAYFYLLLASAIWGVAGPVIKYTLPEFPTVIFLTYRFALTSIVLVPWFLAKKQKLPTSWKEWGILIFAGLLGSTVNLLFVFWGFEKTTALDGSLLSAISPILVVIAGVWFLKEEVTRREIIGLAVILAGTMVTVFQPLLEGKAFAIQNIVGNSLIMVANLVWVAYVILSKIQLNHRYSPLTLTTISFLVGLVSLLPVAVIQAGSMGQLARLVTRASISAHAGVWFMGLLSGALAYVLYQEGQKRIEVSEANIFSYLSLVFAIPLAVFWLAETITLPYILGAGIIAGGVVIAQTRKQGRRA